MSYKTPDRFVSAFDFGQLLLVYPRCIKSITVFDELPGIAVVKVKLKWWSVLTFGLLHRWVKNRLSEVIEGRTTAGIVVQVKVF